MGGRPLPPQVTEAELEKIQARKFASAVAAAAAASGSPGGGGAGGGGGAAGASSSASSSSSENSKPLAASAPKPLNITGARPGAVGANIGFISGATPGSLFVSSSTGQNTTAGMTTTTTTTTTTNTTTTSSTNTIPLLLDNKYQWSPTGTNAYYMSAGFWLTRDEILRQMELHASRGVNTMRVFVAYDFEPNVGTQTSWGVFNELALVNMDHVFAAAAMHGIRIIPVLSNYWPFVGGIKAWVDNYVSATPGAAANQPKEAFFTNPAIRDMFKKWVRLVVTRVNTETGVAYNEVSWLVAWRREEIFSAFFFLRRRGSTRRKKAFCRLFSFSLSYPLFSLSLSSLSFSLSLLFLSLSSLSFFLSLLFLSLFLSCSPLSPSPPLPPRLLLLSPSPTLSLSSPSRPLPPPPPPLSLPLSLFTRTRPSWPGS